MATSHAACLLLLCLLAVSLARTSAAAPPPVLDTDGHELSADAVYYVLPAVRGRGGGLTMAPNVLSCPLFVTQEADELRRGYPVRFTPQQQNGGADQTVHASTDVGVHFAAYTTCVQTTEWHVSGGGDHQAPPLSSRRRRYVLTGPVQDPNPGGRDKLFRVEKQGAGYKLAWCGSASGSCQDLGVFRDERGRAWLGAADQPLVVVFKKAQPVHA